MKLDRLLRWETMLALALLAEFVFFASVSPYFLDVWTLSDASFNFTERAIVALPLALLIIAGEIDISVAAIIALASVAMGLAAAHGVSTPGLAMIGVGTGLLAGAINGALVTIGRVPSIVVMPRLAIASLRMPPPQPTSSTRLPRSEAPVSMYSISKSMKPTRTSCAT